MNIAKFLRKAFFIKHRGDCFWSLPLPFEIIIKKAFQLFSFPQSILASDLEKTGAFNITPYSQENTCVKYLFNSKRLREAAVHSCFSKNKICRKHLCSQETPVLESLLNIAAAQKPYNFTKKRPQHRQFPVNIA